MLTTKKKKEKEKKRKEKKRKVFNKSIHLSKLIIKKNTLGAQYGIKSFFKKVMQLMIKKSSK